MFEIYLNGKLFMKSSNEFVAMNNVVSLRKHYGEKAITVQFVAK